VIGINFETNMQKKERFTKKRIGLTYHERVSKEIKKNFHVKTKENVVTILMDEDACEIYSKD
jgi:hypothetical protein